MAKTTLSTEERARLLDATKEAAAAFVEDMTHIRETLAEQDQLPGRLRRLSAVLRRLLVDNDLRSISPPRVGPVSLLVPDNNPIYHAARRQRLSLFASGGVTVFNCEFRALVGGVGRDFVIDPPFDRRVLTTVSLDGFMSQRVLALNEEWVTRRQVVKYVANNASGVHSGSTQSAEDILLSRIRSYLKFAAHDGGAKIGVNYDAYRISQAPPFVWTPEAVDLVLVELLAAAHFLSSSPDIHSLESAIHKEFGLPAI
jgi:hypothetical protein